MKARARRPARHPRRDVPTSAPEPPRRGVCRVCSCTDERACLGLLANCSWADEEHTLCTFCVEPNGLVRAPQPETRRAA